MISTKWYYGEENLEDVHMIRTRVFIEEQKVPPELEMDGTDVDAIHLAVYDEGVPVATGRVLIKDGVFTLGRIAVLKEHRGKKYGDLVVRMLIRRAFDMGGQKQYLHSQTHARGFYEKLGFAAYGEEFAEAGIPHVSMVHEGDVHGCC